MCGRIGAEERRQLKRTVADGLVARLEVVLQDRAEAMEQRPHDIRDEQNVQRGSHGDVRQITRKQSGDDRDAAEGPAESERGHGEQVTHGECERPVVEQKLCRDHARMDGDECEQKLFAGGKSVIAKAERRSDERGYCP